MRSAWTATSTPSEHHVYILCSFIIVILAVILRFHGLSERSLWSDEAIAAINSQGTVSETVTNTQDRNSSPIFYPLILNAAQRINDSAFAVRLPAALAGTLAVVVLLLLPRVGVDRRVALISGLILAVSSTQIRYSQEVREYALAVFLATLMLYGLLSSVLSTGRKRTLLYATMLFAPFVQYSLVLLGAAVLATLALESLRQHKLKVAIQVVATPAILWVVGCAASYFLTLRYQWRLESKWWYIKDSFYEGQIYNVPKVLAFVATKTYSLLTFTTEGEALVGLAIPAIGVMAYKCTQAPKGENSVSSTILYLLIASIAIVASAAIVRVYPYGGIRQCLYLAPIIALVLGSAYQTVAAGMSQGEGRFWFALVLALVLIAGVKDIHSRKPYADQENIKSVLSTLEHSVNDQDKVYVHYGAKAAIDFYKKGRENFVYGDNHRAEPDGYLTEFDRLVERDVDHVWIIFSHIISGEEKFIIEHLKPRWNIEKKVDAKGASLYFGVRSRTE